MKAIFEALLCIEDVATGDGRILALDSTDFSLVNVPLMLQPVKTRGHDQSYVIGVIQSMYRSSREPNKIYGMGYIDGPYAHLALELLKLNTMGPSIDLDSARGVYDEATDTITLTKSRIRGATIVAIPAFSETYINVVPETEYVNEYYPASITSSAHFTAEVIEGDFYANMTVSAEEFASKELQRTAIPTPEKNYPSEFFVEPTSPYAHKIYIKDDGHVFGYLAPFNACHVAYQEQCIVVPRSNNDYKYFATGIVKTDKGNVKVGVITADTKHEELTASAQATARHYDHTGTVVAYVAIGENELGVWCSGTIAPGATSKQIEILQTCGISGDWRVVNRSQRKRDYDLIAILAVPTPGFALPALDDDDYALVASAAFCYEFGDEIESNDIKEIVAAEADTELERLELELLDYLLSDLLGESV
jgi:hypothetical protein